MLLLGLPLMAQQPTFTINPNSTNVEVGDIFEVDVVVSDFQNLVGTQYGVNWNPAVLKYVSVKNINSTALPGFGLSSSFSVPGGNVPAGQLGVSWFNPSFAPLDVADGTVIFTIELEAIECGNSDIVFTGPPTPGIEILDGDFNEVGLNPENGTATVTGTDCNAAPTPEVSFSIGSANVDEGDEVCVGISVADFENIGSTTFSITYNSSLLTFESVGAFNLAGLSAANFNTATPGVITMDWSNGSAQTLSDGSVLFQLCFTGQQVGNASLAFSNNPQSISVQDGDGEAVDFNGSNGSITVNTINTSTDLTLNVSNASVSSGGDFCLGITVDNFTELIGMSFTVSYDASQLSFNAVSNLTTNLPGFSAAGNIATPSPGFITVSWFDGSLTPVSLPNGELLFNICFTAIGSGSTPVSITSDVTAIEFSDIDENVIPPVINNGTVNIAGGPPPSGDLTINISSASVSQGDDFCLAVTTDNFDGVVGMSFTITYNPSLLSFTEAANLTASLPGFSAAANIANPSPGFITVNWFEQSLTPVGLPNGTLLFNICFDALGGGSSSVAVTSDVTAIEFSDGNEDILPVDTNNGLVNVAGDPTPTGLFLTIDDKVVDPGEDFCTSVKAFNFEDVVGMSFTIAYNPSLLEFNEVINLTTNLPGFSVAANIATPTLGFITVNWFEQSLNPVALPNGEVLFDLCFTALTSGLTAKIEFTSDVASIEFSDSNEDIIPFNSSAGKIIFTGVPTELVVRGETLEVGPAESFCMQITADNFNDIVGMSFTMNYDPMHLAFDQITNINPALTDFTVAGNTGQPSPGVITINWFEQSLNAVDLPNGSVLFEVCFTALGLDGSCSEIVFTDDVTEIEFSDSNEDVAQAFFEDGEVCVSANMPGQISLRVANASVDADDTACVPVTTNNFVDVTEFSFTLEYNATALELETISNINASLGGFTMANIDTSVPGIIAVSWSGSGPVTLPNGATLFTPCFRAIGDPDTCSDVLITGSSEPINFVSSTFGTLDFNGQKGIVCINADFDGFRLTVGSDIVQPGQQFCVPVTTLNFDDILSMAFTLNYNTSQLMFQSITNLTSALPDFTVGANFGLPPNQIAPGNISLVWFNQSLNPSSLPNGTVLFEICFVATGNDGQSSQIVFSSDISPIEISNSNSEIIDFFSQPGTITISAIQPPNIAQAQVENVDCAGAANGSITLSVDGGTGGPYTYTWSNGMSGNPLQSLSGGSYTVTVTDMGSGGLTTTNTYTVSEPANALSVSGGIVPPSCAGGANGSVSLTILGGTPTYNISWDNNIQSGLVNPSNLPGGTYCVTITDNNGCTASQCFTVPNGTGAGATINETITPASCPGDADGSIALSLTGVIGEPIFFWSTAPGVPGTASQTGLSAGSYSVTVIDDAGCSSSKNFTVDEPSAITLTPGLTNIACFGDATGSISLAASGGNGGFSYEWSGPSNFSANTAQISGLVAGNYTVTATDSKDCTTTRSFVLSQPSQALNVATITPTSIDQGVGGAVNIGVQGGTTPYTYSWAGPDNFSATSANLSGLSIGGEYCVTVTDNNDCETTACTTVENVLRVNANITDACADSDNGAISLVPDGGRPPYTYSWTPASLSGANPTGLAAGTYTVLVMDSEGETVSLSLVVGASPAIVFAPAVTPVTGDPDSNNGAITLNVSGGTTPLSFQWAGPGGYSASTANISDLEQGQYCVTVTDSNFGNSCSRDTCFNLLYFAPLVMPDVSMSGTSCAETEDGALQIQINGGVPGFTIEIITANGDVLSGFSANDSYTQGNLPPGTTTINITDAFGGTVSTSVDVSSPDPLESATVNYRHASEGNCNGRIEVSVSGGTPGYTIGWNNGASSTFINGLCSDFSYIPTITDANGCVLTGDSVLINNFDVAIESAVDITCPEDEDGSVTLNVTGGDPGYTFDWRNAQGQQVSNQQNPTGLSPGTYTVVVTEPSGNMLTRQVTLGVQSELAATIASQRDYNGFDVSCHDAADGALSVTATGSNGYMYEWINTSDNSFVGQGANVSSLPVGNYQVMVEDALGCMVTRSIQLTAPEAISVGATIKEIDCHDGKNGAILAAASGGRSPFTYFWSNGAFGNQVASLAAGSYMVTVLDRNSCEQTAAFEVENPMPIMLDFLSEPATDGCNGAVMAQVEGGQEPLTYNWINVVDNNGPQVLNLCPGEYRLQVVDVNGCLSALTSVLVDDRRFPCLEERVILTPDGDGLNDEFIIFCVNDYPENTLEIYNRWGQQVFRAENYNNNWQGTTAGGAELPEGPYYYVLQYTDPEGNTRQQKGSLTILR